jgi:hypothetical protein
MYTPTATYSSTSSTAQDSGDRERQCCWDVALARFLSLVIVTRLLFSLVFRCPPFVSSVLQQSMGEDGGRTLFPNASNHLSYTYFSLCFIGSNNIVYLFVQCKRWLVVSCCCVGTVQYTSLRMLREFVFSIFAAVELLLCIRRRGPSNLG